MERNFKNKSCFKIIQICRKIAIFFNQIKEFEPGKWRKLGGVERVVSKPPEWWRKQQTAASISLLLNMILEFYTIHLCVIIYAGSSIRLCVTFLPTVKDIIWRQCSLGQRDLQGIKRYEGLKSRKESQGLQGSKGMKWIERLFEVSVLQKV